ncbi:hypothetical protein FOQG_18161 [Fusarium oxysporum f. sp. raphani 54005]|uniref:Uncharacterized protein n=1 Tax=Fusarium oxysporum f. sp. raphani 54005 TaxID=1089458 RepID=X0B4R6_FUSOX|nr:hypothetical protein FOQG_18161 [Fusarium oxysporum f. sp. raphani 54005]
MELPVLSHYEYRKSTLPADLHIATVQLWLAVRLQDLFPTVECSKEARALA